MQSITDCFFKVKSICYKYISSQETKNQKFKNKDQMMRSFLIPVCFLISKKTERKKPLIIGLGGGQGSGKTTISSIIALILRKYFKLNVFKVSIDDFYKTRNERKALSRNKHPLLMIRGVPGTHDVDMVLNFLKKIKIKKFKGLKLPKFNKAIDDRYKKNLWYKIKSRPDVVIIEGWCIGAKPQKNSQLNKPINFLERTHDNNFMWRKYVNHQLKTKYKKLFKQLDELVYLRTKSFDLLKKWRIKQEKQLQLRTKNKKNLKIMNQKEVINFMQTYQRITQQMFKDTSKYASVVINLNNKHQINKIKFN